MPWAATGWAPGSSKERAVINSLYIEVEELNELHDRLTARYAEIIENEKRFESYNMDGAEIVIVAYGTVARICKSAIDELKTQGVNVGLLRPITIWPFPYEAVLEAVSTTGVKAALAVELSAGQMVEDVKLAVNGAKPVEFLGYPGSRMPTAEEVKERILIMREGM